ncbi:hypothetical protein, partial [Burkholderia sp. 3C]
MDQPLNKTCGWPIHSDSAAQTIAISGPKYVPHVWMAFTRYRFSAQVLSDLEKHPEPRMQKLDVAAAMNGGAVPNGFAPEAANLTHYVADFSEEADWKKLNDKLL